MIDIELLTEKYEPKDYAVDYSHGTPVPWLYFDDFLPEELFAKIQEEIDAVPRHIWSKFTRNGSYMIECNNFKYSPVLRELALNFNSTEFITWLENITGIEKLLPDPHLIGAGLMRCGTGHSLKLHTDFNWNEQLGLPRALSMILYCSKKWDNSWGGALEFWDFEKKNCLHKIMPTPNRLLIWSYDERFIHGHPTPISCPEDHTRDGFRMFYFKSHAEPLTPPHRSLYWFDDTVGAYDKKENK